MEPMDKFLLHYKVINNWNLICKAPTVWDLQQIIEILSKGFYQRDLFRITQEKD
jgi:hypothetical protein